MSDRRTPVRPQRIRRAEHSRSRAKAAALWRKRIGWGLAIGGVVLFLSGNLGASLGVVILPFDPHHAIGQFGGALLALLGVGIATKER